MGWINLCDPAPPGFFDGVRDTDPYYISPKEERALEAANECPRGCDHGRALVFHCNGVCACGYCPDVEDCPECVGQTDAED